MSRSLSSINIRFAVNLAELSTDLQNSVRQINKTGQELQRIGQSLSLYVTAPVVAAGAASIKMASDFEESQNKVNVAFRDSAGQVQAFAKTSLTSFGIAEGSALDMAALFGDMATSMGLTQAQAAQLSVSLVGLAGDLASFKNIGIDEATTALNGVFTGETESLKRLGIVMTETNLQQFALSQGITKNIKDFTQAEKVQLRYAYVMANTTNAQGDFARTGGGAANQMRVFQESLKELAVTFGQEILPAFTNVLREINQYISKLKEMSPESRRFIVVTAGIAAAIGPVAAGLGALVKIYASGIAQMARFSAAVGSLNASLLAVAAVAGTAVAAYALFNREASKINAAQKVLSEVSLAASKAISGEKAVLDSLLKTARDESLAKEKRLAAIKQINQISPEYLGNINLENIKTKEVTESIDNYIKKLKQQAEAQAAQSKRTELYGQKTDVLERPLGESKNVVDDALKIIYNKLGIDTENVVIRNREELEKYIKTLKLNAEGAEAMRKVYEPYLRQKERDIKLIEEQIKALDKYGIIEEETRTGGGGGGGGGSDTKTITERVKVKSVFEDVTPPGLNMSEAGKRVDFYDKEIEKLKKVQSAYQETDAEWQELQRQIEGYEFAIKMNVDPSSVIQAQLPVQELAAATAAAAETAEEKMARLRETAIALGDSVGNAFNSMGGRIVDSLGLANDGFEGFVKGMYQTVIELMSMLLAQSIAQAIAGATASAAATGPGAIFTQPAFIATAVGGVLAAFASIPKFEDGGIVGGNSFTGDRLFARVNSGEMILNQRQQRNLMNMINPAASSADLNMVFVPDVRISGDSLLIVYERAQQKKKRGG